jgi:hypothetical protein
MRIGLDISRYQHNPAIDYKTVSNWLKFISDPHEPFVFDNSEDPYYLQNQSGFTTQGILWASYHFANPSIPATEDEQHFRALVGKIPGALDLETIPPGMSDLSLRDWRNLWLSQPAEKLSLDYTNQDFLNRIGPMPFHGLWFAGSSPGPIPETVLWQSGQVQVPGINGPVDINKWIGTDLQFSEFFGINPPAPQPRGGFVETIRSTVGKTLWWLKENQW